MSSQITTDELLASGSQLGNNYYPAMETDTFIAATMPSNSIVEVKWACAYNGSAATQRVSPSATLDSMTWTQIAIGGPYIVGTGVYADAGSVVSRCYGNIATTSVPQAYSLGSIWLYKDSGSGNPQVFSGSVESSPPSPFVTCTINAAFVGLNSTYLASNIIRIEGAPVQATASNSKPNYLGSASIVRNGFVLQCRIIQSGF